jgi:hypothetical protein
VDPADDLCIRRRGRDGADGGMHGIPLLSLLGAPGR